MSTRILIGTEESCTRPIARFFCSTTDRFELRSDPRAYPLDMLLARYAKFRCEVDAGKVVANA